MNIATIIKPHGLNGELVVEFSSDIPENILPGAELFIGKKQLSATVSGIRRMNQRYLLKLEGTTSREVAEALRGDTVYMRAADVPALPPDEYYFHQLIGLAVEQSDGEHIGVLSEIIQTGANDVYVVTPESGKDVLFPVIQSVVKEIDIEKGKIIIEPPDWY